MPHDGIVSENVLLSVVFCGLSAGEWDVSTDRLLIAGMKDEDERCTVTQSESRSHAVTDKRFVRLPFLSSLVLLLPLLAVCCIVISLELFDIMLSRLLRVSACTTLAPRSPALLSLRKTMSTSCLSRENVTAATSISTTIILQHRCCFSSRGMTTK